MTPTVKRAPGRPVGPSDDLNEDELRAIVNLPDRRSREGLRDYAVILLFLNTPMRKGELVRLTVGNILDEGESQYVTYEGLKKRKFTKKDDGTIEIKKRRYWLKIPITREVYDAIMRYVRTEYRSKKLDGAAPLLFTLGKHGPYKKRPLTPWAVDLIVRKYSRLAGINKRVTPHSFRATYLTLRISGRNPADLLGLSGHKDIRGLIPYARADEKRRKEAALAFSFS